MQETQSAAAESQEGQGTLESHYNNSFWTSKRVNTPCKYVVGVTTVLDKVLTRRHVCEMLEEEHGAPKEGKRQLLKCGVEGGRGDGVSADFVALLPRRCHGDNLLEWVEGGRRGVRSLEVSEGMDKLHCV